MRKLLLWLLAFLTSTLAVAQQDVKLKKRDHKRDIELVTTDGTIILRLYDSTPLHRDNFLRLVKSHYYDSVLFHRVIKNFMIQAGDPDSKHAEAGQPLGEGGPDYTIPAEFRSTLFHRKGALAAARESDDVNPQKRSGAAQFYIVQGRKFTATGLDSLETFRLKGRKIPAAQREAYKTVGGSPHLDQNYTVFGFVVNGLDVVDKIAAAATSKDEDRDRPLADVRIQRPGLSNVKSTIKRNLFLSLNLCLILQPKFYV
jgi:cyclophilin family peptidyl-prolyl cis-trans isomerase